MRIQQSAVRVQFRIIGSWFTPITVTAGGGTQINGFGRIGRLFLRAALTKADVEVVAINVSFAALICLSWQQLVHSPPQARVCRCRTRSPDAAYMESAHPPAVAASVRAQS